MILPFRQVRDADRGYALNLLVAFVERHNRNPDDTATLADWWSLPLPIHQRLGVLGGVAATYPEYAPKVRRGLQDAALLAAESALPVWSAIHPDDLTLTIALDAARAHFESPTRDGRAKVRRLARAVRDVLASADGKAHNAALTIYNALFIASPADDDDLWTTHREVIRLLIGAKDAGVDMATATARLDALVSELNGANP
jgi:hypothetical protein